MTITDPSQLADMLRAAASAHDVYERSLGHFDSDWPHGMRVTFSTINPSLKPECSEITGLESMKPGIDLTSKSPHPSGSLKAAVGPAPKRVPVPQVPHRTTLMPIAFHPILQDMVFTWSFFQTAPSHQKGLPVVESRFVGVSPVESWLGATGSNSGAILASPAIVVIFLSHVA